MRWRLRYTLQVAGDSPLPREIDVDLPTEDADEEHALEMMRVEVRERAGGDAVLTDAESI